jgi:hypothetical protein
MMKYPFYFLFLVGLFVFSVPAFSQDAVPANTDSTSSIRKKNIIKTNITGIPLRNYSLQFERVLNKRFSLALSYRIMPEGSIPFKNWIKNSIEDGDQEAMDQVESLQLSNKAITAELRWYVGKKGYGRGFYIAPFFRHANHKAKNVSFEYDSDLGGTEKVDLSGSLVSNTGGLLFGAQWFLGKAVVLDWWILGPHYGSGNGDLKGLTSTPMSAQEQEDLRQELEDIDIPLTTKTVFVDANGAAIKLEGPWAGIRAGISLGIRF